MTGLVIWSILPIIFVIIGVTCRKSAQPSGFFTFVKPPDVNDVKRFNNAVAALWFIAAAAAEILGILFMLPEQNSPLFILLIFAVIIGVILLMLAYRQIEARFGK